MEFEYINTVLSINMRLLEWLIRCEINDVNKSIMGLIIATALMLWLQLGNWDCKSIASAIKYQWSDLLIVVYVF